MDAGVGDRIEVHGTQVGQPVRRGIVRERLREDPLELRVEWEDGHETVLLPSGGMVRVIAEDGGSR